MQNNIRKDCKINIERGLLLYHHPYSYYSQKVLMALHEKCLPFEEYVINLVTSEQYEQWFLDLNPRGEFPVLDASGLIIPGSNKILIYLEDRYKFDESIPQLILIDEDHKIRQKVTYFRYHLDQIQSGIITLGSFFHEEYVGRPKLPFIKPVRTAMKNAENNRVKFLSDQMEYNPRYRHVFQGKIQSSFIRHAIITSKEEFRQQLKLIDDVLDKIEGELASHDPTDDKIWLCCDSFTIADVSLTVLLERLNVLGLEDHFWGKNKHPHILNYYKRVQERLSYKKTMPSIKTHLRLLRQGHKCCTIGTFVLTSGFLLLGCILVVRRLLR